MEKSAKRDREETKERNDFCSEKFRERIEKHFQKECLDFPMIMQEIEAKISRLLLTSMEHQSKVEPENLRCALQYLYSNMPLSDRVSYPFETYLDYAIRGVYLRENRNYVQALPEELFFPYVLFHRVNEEEILPCRSLFGDQIELWLKEGMEALFQEVKEDFALEQRAKNSRNKALDKTLDEALDSTLDKALDSTLDKALKITPKLIKEINYWCSREGTYQSTDNRTLSALMFYTRGYGRCGEESVFAVNAMRSMGIPCRQVYAPRWAHCEDNHAWIEVFVEGNWQFLGACEPLEHLNIGWFNAAASRAILIHSRYFGEDIFDSFLKSESMDEHSVVSEEGKNDSKNYEKIENKSFPKVEILGKEGIVTELNQISRYAESKEIAIHVLDSKGYPVPNAIVSLLLLNTGEFYPIARLKSDAEGRVFFHTGLGTLLLEVQHEKGKASELIDTREGDSFSLHLSGERKEGEWRDLDFFAPMDSEKNPNTETEEEKARGKKRLSLCKLTLRQKIKAYQNPAIVSFLQHSDREMREEFLHVLSEKDLSDVSLEVLEESYFEDGHFKGDMQVGSLETTPESTEYLKKLVFPYLMNPRVDEEILRPYRNIILMSFSHQDKELFRKEPKEIQKWIQKEIESHPNKERRSIITPPAACLIGRVGSSLSQAILFVAIARSLGIPARLRKSDKAMEYWDKTRSRFVPVLEEERESCKILFRKNTEESLQYGQHWTVAREIAGEYKTLDLRNQVFCQSSLEISAVPGKYKIITENRLPNGNIQGADYVFSLKERERKEIEVYYREAELKDMLERLLLPDFTLEKEDGTRENSLFLLQKTEYPKDNLVGRGKRAIFFWLEPGAEPTEHILNEILEQKERFSLISERMNFVIRDPKEVKDPLFQKVRQALTKCNLYFDTENQDEFLARRMYVEPGSYPFILFTEEDKEQVYGIYAVSGYQVGTGDMLLRIMEE